MANVMYLPYELRSSLSTQLPAFFGSTLLAISFHSKQDDTFTELKASAIAWCRKHALEEALEKLRKLHRRLNDLLVGTGQSKDQDPVKKPLPDSIFDGTKTMKDSLIQGLKGKVVALHARWFIFDPSTRSTLQARLKRVIELRFADDYDPDSIDVVQSWQNLLSHYITPQVGANNDLIVKFWNDHKDDLFKKIDWLRSHAERPRASERTPFGQCAETYPVVGVGYAIYFPFMSRLMHNVRGFALNPRGIGKTSIFNTEVFSLVALRKIPAHDPNKPTEYISRADDKGCCRYPCSFCRMMMPMFGVAASLPSDYDKDMDAAAVEPY
ncbi:hypothetical protein EK21DRAFT_107548 [Setomelanomma holmii]|uniref:Uncharacterized protein n=1 Tax=Setomelanomma holmii TaxID=210430 RepID=A0A9P4HGT7_9PLEO|nr:hypothetical protein EK21DRAFT_107548 [Setomelanomma holmii]